MYCKRSTDLKAELHGSFLKFSVHPGLTMKVLLFNPRSANSKHRIPNSILQVAASIEGVYDYAIVDGNLEKDPWGKIASLLNSGDYFCFGCTVMPGPQLQQAIPYSKAIKAEYPSVKVIWGGYFASNQFQTVLKSGFVDYVIYGHGDEAFPKLLGAISGNQAVDGVPNLAYVMQGRVTKNASTPIPDQDALPPLPYEKLDSFYSIRKYLGKTFLGKRTVAYHSSMGCPFTCSFCAVVPLYNARWKGKSASLVYADIKYLIDHFEADAVEFHDNNFFVSEKRTVEFAQLIQSENISWWGEGRIDTIDKYSDQSLALMRKAGCKMIFFGAETSNDELLQQMEKGGTQSTEQMKRFAARLAQFDIIPEYSFVLGFPGPTPEAVEAQIDRDIAFIKEIKSINPRTEIIIYVYSPVPTEGSDIYEHAKQAGFHFPTRLEQWLEPDWLRFDLRKNPLTPWLTPRMINKILGFEAVLNAQYPTISDFKVTQFQRQIMRAISGWRYRSNIFDFPYEVKALQKYWLRYRQPEVEGFYSE